MGCSINSSAAVEAAAQSSSAICCSPPGLSAQYFDRSMINRWTRWPCGTAPRSSLSPETCNSIRHSATGFLWCDIVTYSSNLGSGHKFRFILACCPCCGVFCVFVRVWWNKKCDVFCIHFVLVAFVFSYSRRSQAYAFHLAHSSVFLYTTLSQISRSTNAYPMHHRCILSLHHNRIRNWQIWI